ncbi:dedicator of cytokinesis protein 9 isoform X1 [Hydra vulgaris]|uniref:dedicator of cytokinesis protein 9 isoform X1 n=2 Tax=Hydra vulgaris TaxID=6087 RepID=UPI001F5F9851|nr:dedicator of cytokinesis protein 9 isoform X1 [Hydra vulgaris]
MTDNKKAKSAGKLKLNYIIENDQQPVVIIREDHVERKLNLDRSLKDLSVGIEPIDYEKEITVKKNEIKRDPLKSLLLFPDDDVQFICREQELRTEYSTVPPQAHKDATDLFVQECLKVYTCKYWILENKYAEYGQSFHTFNEYGRTKELKQHIFEQDLSTDNTDNVQESLLIPLKEKGIYREGYLTKSPFHSDGIPSYGSKTYKRRWFTLKQTSLDGSYVLEYRKEEGSAMAKGTLYLDSCTQIRKGFKGRVYGFELYIQDKVYGLAADSLSEMEAWIRDLCKATGIEIEQEKKFVSEYNGKLVHIKQKNLKESLKNSSHPVLQEYAKESDQGNYKSRQECRYNLFSIYSDLCNSYSLPEVKVNKVEPFNELPAIRLKVSCKSLKFKLCQEDLTNCEPFYFTLSLFDAKHNVKLSEDFCCELNHPSLNEFAVSNENSPSGENNDAKAKNFHSPKDCVFTVNSPHSEIYLVVRINKMLQGGIGQCAEPYIKHFDNPKFVQKVYKQFRQNCKRLGVYSMPFGWGARSLFKSNKGDIEELCEVTSIFKQEAAKLTDEELLKSLQNLKGETKSKQTIPGSFVYSLSLLPPNHQNCYSPSLIPLKPFSRSDDVLVSLQVQTFHQENIETISPATEYCANFYVYPLSLNYSLQKSVKARNIACTIQFRDTDDASAKPLKCIYERNGTCKFTHEITCPILYHTPNPTFYEEIKILLPPQLTPMHHVLFIFNHISVEQPKKKEIMTPVGYCWMPILLNNVIRPDESFMPVALNLPSNYLSITDSRQIDVKWADGKGQNLFKVSTKLVSTINTQDADINAFFSHWQHTEGKPSSDVETSRLLKLMYGVNSIVVIKFLPVLLNQLFHVLIHGNNQDVAVNVVSLIIRIVSLTHKENKSSYLKSYVKFIFKTDVTQNKTVHEELSKHLIFFLRLGADPEMIANILQYSWFFFEIMTKSMALSSMSDLKRFESKKPREQCFSADFHHSLENLVQVFIFQLVSRVKETPEIKEANLHLAAFLKSAFTHMDRGYVFHIINYLKDQFIPADTQMFELKFEFLRSVFEYEHYIPLNLPIDIRMKGDVHESTLNDTFCSSHFLVGILLRELSTALYEPKVVRKYAIRVLRNLLVKHEFDDRYQSEEMQSRIASLYIPYLTMMLEHSIRFHKSLELTEDGLIHISDDKSSPRRISKVSALYSVISSSTSTTDSTGKNPPILPFDEDEAKELMICFLYILKSLKPVIIVDWWRDILTTTIKRSHWVPAATLYYASQEKNYAKFMAIIGFFDLLECCLSIFKYCGKKMVVEKNTSDIAKQFFENKYSSINKQSFRTSAIMRDHANHMRSSSSASNVSQITTSSEISRNSLDTNLSAEVSLVVLDMLELFCAHFKFHLEQDEGDNILMKQIFNVMMTFLRVPQSESIMKHVFATLRSFIQKFPTSLFKGSSNLCGVLCYEILCLCNSKIESVRTQACCFMYLLMRCNYDYSGNGCVRVHHQVIVAVSKLIASGMNRASMSQSLVTLKNYAIEDKGMKTTEFSGEVRDLIKKVHTVLHATSQMKEHEDDHEVLVDLQYSLAKSYASTPELRQTWLESMAIIHEKKGDYSEAAMCYIHSAALVAEYLKAKSMYAHGCSSFKAISPNLIPDESRLNDDEGDTAETRYTLKNLIELLEVSVERLKLAERYEIVGEVYKLAIPLYEEERNYQCLALAYGVLKESYEKVVQVTISGKRILGRYYRVAFFGRVFKESDGKEFVYKEPKVTSLSEISLRLSEKYNSKYGNVKLIQDSSKVKPEELNPAVNYVQVSFVTPYFDEDEYKSRITEFERENNVRRFVFETPFTLSGKAHGALAEQHKRKTILTTSHCFPYVKKRILVVQQEIYELSPIEVAIDEMRSKVKELNQVISLDPPDMKKLQLKLGGTVSVQVNAGPLAYAQTFLESTIIKNYLPKHIEALQITYREFIKVCGQALKLNAILIKPDQAAYQEDLKERYAVLKEKVATYVGEGNEERVTIQLPQHSDA